MNSQHIIAQAFLRAWPFPRGAGRIIDQYFSTLKFEKQIATIQTTDGFNISVEPNELIGRHIYLTGEFDRSTVEMVCNFSRPGDVLLDIGANVGYISACFLKNVPNSSVIAVEPQPGILDLLKSNLGQFGRSQVYPYALGDRNDEASIKIDTFNKGASRVVSGGGDHKIEMRSADRMFAELDIKHVDIVKLDVEGSEESILRSLLPQLKRPRPRAIIFENHPADNQSNIFKLLTSFGYRSYGIKKHLTKLELQPENGDMSHLHDFVAISDWRLVPPKAKAAYGIQMKDPYGPLPPH
jgi:FkbM family methyltransferase